MVQEGTPERRGAGNAPERQGTGNAPERRARSRLERRHAFLRTAKGIVFSDGLEALTMSRLARELDCAIGTAYTYFSSKSALVAELQREAIEAIASSWERFDARLAEELSEDPGAAEGAAPGPAVHLLARLVGFARFWMDTFDTFPEEARLLQLLLSEPFPTVDDEDVSRVLPSAVTLLGRAQASLDAAAAAGVLDPGDALERAVVAASALNGILLLDHLAHVDPGLFDSHRLARTFLDDLLAGWGADRPALDAAWRRIDELTRQGPLATR